MSGHDGRAREISKNEVLLANERAKFDAWLEQNAGMEGQKEYQDYVSNFRTWEKNIEQRQRELRDSIARQPVVETPTLPGQSLDEQVAEAVKNISINDFLTALLSLAKDNPSFVPKLEQVIQRETQSASFYNPAVGPPPAVQALMPGLPPMPVFPASKGVAIPPPAVYSAPPPVRTTFIAYNASSAQPVGPARNYQQPVYTQQTPHGVIPEGWVVDEPIRRQKRSPAPERQHLPKLPFKDFSQT